MTPAREGGTGVVISPIIVNDNVIDVTFGPGAAEGSPAVVTTSPTTSYVTFINKAITGAAGSRASLDAASDVANPDGTRVVTLIGSAPLGKPPILDNYPVPQPSVFAEMVFREALVAAIHIGLALAALIALVSVWQCRRVPTVKLTRKFEPTVAAD